MVGLAGGVAVLWQAACSGPGTTGGVGAPGANRPEVQLRGVTFDRIRGGQIVASGRAEALTFHRSGERLSATGVQARVLAAGGGLLDALGTLELTAPSVAGDLGAGRARASGGVQLGCGDGTRGFTDHVDLDRQTGRLVADAPVQFTGPTLKLSAQALEARTDGSSVSLHRGVRGELRAAAGGRP